MRNVMLAFALSVPLVLAAGAEPASATPLSAASGLATAVPDELVHQVHRRRYWHCHSRGRRIRCHDGFRPRRCERVRIHSCRPNGRCVTRFVRRCR